MTLEEQFEKETGFIRPTTPIYPHERKLRDVIKYYQDYSEWLEEKLTWKKFSEKKPNVGRDILVKCEGFITGFNSINQQVLDKLIKHWTKWMYIPE